MKKILLVIPWLYSLSGPILAQINNNGAKVIIQSGVYVVSAIDVRNTNGGTLQNEGTLITTQNLSNSTGAALSGNGAYRVGINWTNSATFTAGTSSVAFDGAQNSAATSGGSPFYNVSLNKSAGFHVSLSDAMSIANTLDFPATGNHLLLGNFNLSLGNVTGFGADRFITTGGTGKVLKNVAGPFTFPVGFDKTTYNPLTLTQSGTPDVLGVRCLQNALVNGATGAPFTQNTVDVGWDVMEQTPGGSNLAMSFQWALGDELPLFDRASMSASRHDGANWQVAGAAGAGGGANPYQFSAAGITAPGIFVLSNQCLLTDGVPPTIACPNNISRNTDANLCTAIVYYAPTVSDNCPGATFALVSGLASGSAFPKGPTMVTLKAIDAKNQMSANCSFMVTVTDNQLPSITCPADIIRYTGPGTCAATVTYADPTYSDNCTGAVLSKVSGPASGDPVAKGTTSAIWKVVDAASLMAQCTINIIVIDNIAPTITCPATQSVSTGPTTCTASVTYNNPMAADNCTPAPTVMFVSGGTGTVQGVSTSTATFDKGITTVQWKATDGVGLTKTCTFRVIVNDLQAPTLNCTTPAPLNTAPGLCSATFTYVNPTFTDNCMPTSGTSVRISGPVSGSAFPVGNTNVTFQATDASGNTKRCTMVVTVTDNQVPVVTCPSPVVVAGSGSPCVAVAFYANPTATDNCAGTLNPFLLSGLASGSSFPAGVTTNTWRAIAPNGQTADCSFDVTVTCGAPKSGSTEDREAEAAGAANVPSRSHLLTFSLSPNPAAEEAWLDLSASKGLPCAVRLLDTRGALVQQHPVAQTTAAGLFRLDLGGLPNGLYFVQVQVPGRVAQVLKLVVARG